MNLKSLNLSRNDYGFAYQGTPPGCIGGTISYDGEGGQVTIRLTRAHVAQILAIVADAMVETTRELANNLTRETIEHATSALPAPESNPQSALEL